MAAESGAPLPAGNAGDFWFHFKPGKIARETHNGSKWHIFAEVTDREVVVTGYIGSIEMNAYTEITVGAEDMERESFTGDVYETTVKYLASVPFLGEIAASENWAGGEGAIALTANDEPGSKELLITVPASDGEILKVSTDFATITTENITAESGLQLDCLLRLERGIDIRDFSLAGSVYIRISPPE